MILNYFKQGTMTAALGTISVTIPAVDGKCVLLHVSSATATTTFDVRLTDRFSINVLDDTDATGTYNQLMQMPVYGNFTLTVRNASVNELFTYLIVIQEN